MILKKFLVYLDKSNNMPDIFFYPPYYSIQVCKENKEIKIYSNSKHAKGRELSQYLNKDGYLKVHFKDKSHFIHSLIAKFYLGQRPNGLCVNHIDGNKLNNMPDNLEYVTLAYNTKHSISNGMHICNKPELMPRYKDGRCKDIVKYKRNWYLENRDRILKKAKLNYESKKENAY